MTNYECLFNSQFNYCPLAWMFHNCKLNKITQTMLKNYYNNSSSTFEWLLTKDNSVSIHNWNLQVLATETFKDYAEQEPDILQDVFPIRTVCYGDNSLRYLRPKLRELIPSEIKDIESFEVFNTRQLPMWTLQNLHSRSWFHMIQTAFSYIYF